MLKKDQAGVDERRGLQHDQDIEYPRIDAYAAEIALNSEFRPFENDPDANKQERYQHYLAFCAGHNNAKRPKAKHVSCFEISSSYF